MTLVINGGLLFNAWLFMSNVIRTPNNPHPMLVKIFALFTRNTELVKIIKDQGRTFISIAGK